NAVAPPHGAKDNAVAPPHSVPDAFSFARPDCDHVVVETVKRAEDGDGWIVRLYEAKQFCSATVVVRFGLTLSRVVECDLMEEEVGPAHGEGNELEFPIAPYEIKTFRVWFG
ncbi:MAG: glycosyl hydrolase-related protein, partial [Trueperaceae bacterium]